MIKVWNKYSIFVDMKRVILILLCIILVSCQKTTKFDNITYEVGGFGLENIHLSINDDGSYILKIRADLLELVDNETILPERIYEGKITDDELKQIQRGIYKISQKDYIYENPEFVITERVNKLIIREGEISKKYIIYNASEDFHRDILKILNEICEKIKTKQNPNISK